MRTTSLRIALVFVCGWFLTGTAIAQAHDFRCFLLPKVGSVTTPFTDGVRPKYLKELGVSYATVDYGSEATVVACAYVDDQQYLSVAVNEDVVAIPQLDSRINATGLAKIQTVFEGLKLPSDALVNGMTWRRIAAFVLHIFEFMQRYDGGTGQSYFDSGVALNTRANQLSAGVRTRLQETAQSFGIDTSSLNGSTTVREFLKFIEPKMPKVFLLDQVF